MSQSREVQEQAIYDDMVVCVLWLIYEDLARGMGD